LEAGLLLAAWKQLCYIFKRNLIASKKDEPAMKTHQISILLIMLSFLLLAACSQNTPVATSEAGLTEQNSSKKATDSAAHDHDHDDHDHDHDHDDHDH